MSEEFQDMGEPEGAEYQQELENQEYQEILAKDSGYQEYLVELEKRNE